MQAGFCPSYLFSLTHTYAHTLPSAKEKYMPVLSKGQYSRQTYHALNTACLSDIRPEGSK